MSWWNTFWKKPEREKTYTEIIVECLFEDFWEEPKQKSKNLVNVLAGRLYGDFIKMISGPEN